MLWKAAEVLPSPSVGVLVHAGYWSGDFSRTEIEGLDIMLPAARKLNSEVLKHQRCVSCVSPYGPGLVSDITGDPCFPPEWTSSDHFPS